MSVPPRCFVIHPADNVATLLDAIAAPGPVRVLGDVTVEPLHAREPATEGHKLALCDIGLDAPIVKYGVRIGRATRPIAAGQWVHLHNCASAYDERSGTLDPHTGTTTDTRYE